MRPARTSALAGLASRKARKLSKCNDNSTQAPTAWTDAVRTDSAKNASSPSSAPRSSCRTTPLRPSCVTASAPTHST